LLIRLDKVGIRHGTLSFRSAVHLPLVSPFRQDRLAILVFLRVSIRVLWARNVSSPLTSTWSLGVSLMHM
jgi:hypothetical protein